MPERNDINDGGPAFPCAEDHKVAADILWTQGMSKRELFAAKVLPTVWDRFWRGVDAGEYACPEGWRDGVAQDACLQADALLRALSEPQPEPTPAFPQFNVYAASSEQKDALRRLHTRSWFEALPAALRTYVTDAAGSIASAEANEDDIPF